MCACVVPTYLLYAVPVFLTSIPIHSRTHTVRTPATRAHFRQSLQRDNAVNNIVANGGWFAAEEAATNALAAANFETLRPAMMHNNNDVNVVEAGGWYSLQQHAADPKGLLVQYMMRDTTCSNSNNSCNINLNAVVALLGASGKGFDSDLVDGEWTLVVNQQGSKSPVSQKLVAKMASAAAAVRRRKKIRSFDSGADFDVSQQQFYGRAALLKYGMLRSTVNYRPVADNFYTNSQKKIVLRRIACDLVGASWKFWKLPTLPLPLRKKGGFLDFVFMDSDMRITKGNRGGLFVHARPAFLETLME